MEIGLNQPESSNRTPPHNQLPRITGLSSVASLQNWPRLDFHFNRH